MRELHRTTVQGREALPGAVRLGDKILAFDDPTDGDVHIGGFRDGMDVAARKVSVAGLRPGQGVIRYILDAAVVLHVQLDRAAPGARVYGDDTRRPRAADPCDRGARDVCCVQGKVAAGAACVHAAHRFAEGHGEAHL